MRADFEWAHLDWVTSVAWSADGRVCSGSDDGSVRVWDVEPVTVSLWILRGL